MIMKEYLTSQERKAIIKGLTKPQIQAIEKYKRLKHQSNWLTQLNKAEGVDFIFEKEEVYYDYDPHHPLDSPLRCSCGHPVKYLLLCRSRSTDKITGFSIDHLAEEAHVPKSIVKQVQNLNHTIDKGADIIYSMIKSGLTFPKWLLNYINRHHLSDQIPVNKRRYIVDFYNADIPLHPDDFSLLKSIYHRHRDIVVGKIIAKQQLNAERKYHYKQLNAWKRQKKREYKHKIRAIIYKKAYQKDSIRWLLHDLTELIQVKENSAKVEAYFRAQQLALKKKEEQERQERAELELKRDKNYKILQDHLQQKRAKKEARRDANNSAYHQFVLAFQNKLKSTLSTSISSYINTNDLLDLLIVFVITANSNNSIPSIEALNNKLRAYLVRYKKLKLTLQFSDPDFSNIFYVASLRLTQLVKIFIKHNLIKLG